MTREEQEKYFNVIREKFGNEARLQAIAESGLGMRSEAARRVLIKRAMRREMIEQGFDKGWVYSLVRSLPSSYFINPKNL